MRDFLGKELRVGDECVYVRLSYRELTRGSIVKLTPKMVVFNTGVRQFPEQVIKI